MREVTIARVPPTFRSRGGTPEWGGHWLSVNPLLLLHSVAKTPHSTLGSGVLATEMWRQSVTFIKYR
jgi:hypothetical protein